MNAHPGMFRIPRSTAIGDVYFGERGNEHNGLFLLDADAEAVNVAYRYGCPDLSQKSKTSTV